MNTPKNADTQSVQEDIETHLKTLDAHTATIAKALENLAREYRVRLNQGYDPR